MEQPDGFCKLLPIKLCRTFSFLRWSTDNVIAGHHDFCAVRKCRILGRQVEVSETSKLNGRDGPLGERNRERTLSLDEAESKVYALGKLVFAPS